MNQPLPIPNFTKVKTIRTYEDGSSEIDTRSVTRRLSSIKQEIQQTVDTNPTTLAADIIKCLEPITYHETSELTLHISTNPATGNARIITKTWTVDKEHFGRR